MSQNARATWRSFYGHGSSKSGRAAGHDTDLGRVAGHSAHDRLQGQPEPLNLSSHFEKQLQSQF